MRLARRNSCADRPSISAISVSIALALFLTSCTDADPVTSAFEIKADQICKGRTVTIGLLGFEGNPVEAEAKQVAVELAIEDVNTAGGIFGSPVELKQSLVPNEGFDKVTKQDLLDAAEELADVDAIVTLVGSRHSIDVLREGPDRVPQISGFQTSSELIEIGAGRYFRTVPSDVIQGSLIAEEILGAGYQRVAVLHQDDTYGDSLANAFLDRVRKRSGIEPIQRTPFGDLVPIQAKLDELAANEPDAVVFFGYSVQAAQMIEELDSRGISDIDFWLSDGGAGVDVELQNIGANTEILNGVRLVGPSPDLNRTAVAAFRQRLAERLGYENEFVLAPESYDAGIMAAVAAASTCANPDDLAKAIVDVSLANGASARKCSIAASSPQGVLTEPGDQPAPAASEGEAPENCLDLLWQSRLDVDIDYDGIAGSVDLDSNGEPGRGGYLIRTYGTNGVDSSQTRFVLEAAQSNVARSALLPRIEFANGSAQIPSSALPNLNQAAFALLQPEVGVISVEGYASLDGNPAANSILAQARADEVRDALIERGAPADKLVAVGKSATDRFPENRVVVFVDQEGE